MYHVQRLIPNRCDVLQQPVFHEVHLTFAAEQYGSHHNSVFILCLANIFCSLLPIREHALDCSPSMGYGPCELCLAVGQLSVELILCSDTL